MGISVLGAQDKVEIKPLSFHSKNIELRQLPFLAHDQCQENGLSGFLRDQERNILSNYQHKQCQVVKCKGICYQ